MKKFLLLVILSFNVLTILAQKNDLPYDFPIKPGTTAWTKLKSTKEIYDSTQIPSAILKDLSTEALVKTCLNYPNLLLMYAFDDFQKGFNELKNNFNGFQELMIRKDAGNELFKIYQQMNPMQLNESWTSEKQGAFVISIKYVEVIISQYPILNSLSESEKKILTQESIKKFDEKKINLGVFGIPGLETTSLIMARILEIKNGHYKKAETIQIFL